jgi:hypothetical protein
MTRILSGKTFSKFHILRFPPSSGYIQINTTDALTNRPGYIENVKILTTNRGNYQASLLRIQNKSLRPSCISCTWTFSRTAPRALQCFHFLLPHHPLCFTQLHNRILCFPKLSLEPICASFATLQCRYLLVLRRQLSPQFSIFLIKFRLWRVVPAPAVGWSFQR